MDFQKDSLYLIFSIQFLAWLVYMDSLLIKQVFIELYFTLGSLLAFSWERRFSRDGIRNKSMSNVWEGAMEKK